MGAKVWGQSSADRFLRLRDIFNYFGRFGTCSRSFIRFSAADTAVPAVPRSSCRPPFGAAAADLA